MYVDLPPVTQSFNETNTYVWLPIDPESVETPEALIQQGSLKEQIGDSSGALVSYR